MTEEAKPEVVAKSEYEALKNKHTELGGKLTHFEKEFEKVTKWGGLEKIGADLEAFNILQEEVAKENPDKMKEWKSTTETKIRGTVQEEINGLKTRAETSEKKYKELAVVDRAFSAAAPKLVKAAHGDFKELARIHGDLDDNGKLMFKNEKGEVLYKEGSATEPLDADGFANWAEKYKPHYFASTAVSGDREAGTNGTGSSGSGVTVEQYLSMSAAEHSRLPLQVRADLAKRARAGKN